MTRSERELLIQRYLSGEMTSSEEGDFFLQVALDKELRHDLQAQKTVESAFRKDREAVPAEHTGLRLRMAGMLAASAPAPPKPAPSASVPNGSGLTRIIGRIGFSPAQWLVTAAAAVAITVGSVLIFPGGGSVPPPSSPAREAAPRDGSGAAVNAVTGKSAPETAPTPRDAVEMSTAGSSSDTHERSAVEAPAADVSRRAQNSRRSSVSADRAAALHGAEGDVDRSIGEKSGAGDADNPDRPEKSRVDTLNLNARVRINPNGGAHN